MMLRVLLLIFVVSVSYHVRHVSATNTVYNSCPAREALSSHSCVRLFQQTAIASQSNVHFYYNYQDTSSDGGNVAWYLIPANSEGSGCSFSRCVGGICGMREATFSGSTTLGDYPGAVELWAVNKNQFVNINIKCVTSYFTYNAVVYSPVATVVTVLTPTPTTSSAKTIVHTINSSPVATVTTSRTPTHTAIPPVPSISATPSPQSVTTLGTDALIALYDSTNGAHWTFHNNWLIGDPCANHWFGVTCTSGQVTKLDLGSNALNGTLTSLSGLISLEIVDLSDNQLSGSIPSFSGCTNLQTIVLSESQLSGSIPSFSGCTNLQYVDLSENQLSGSIPSFSGCTNLQKIFLRYNQLSGSIPSFNGCTNLQYIDSSNNQLSGSIPSFSGCTNLQTIIADYNQLSGSLPSFSGCYNLSDISFAFNQLSGSIPSFNQCHNLNDIVLYGNQLTGSIPSFNGLSLFRVSLGQNQLSGSIPSFNDCKFSPGGGMYLNNNQLTGFVPPDFLPNTTFPPYLDLTNNLFTCPLSTFQYCTEDNCGPCYLEGAAMTNIMNSLINHNQTNALNVATKYCSAKFSSFCPLQVNLENGLDLYSIQDNSVSPLSWNSYQQSVSWSVTTVSAYEASIRQYEIEKGQTSALLQLAHDSVNNAHNEVQVWNEAIVATTNLMKATMSEGQTLRGQINQEFTLLDESFAELNSDITNKIQQINQQITKLSSHTFFSDMVDIIETVGGLVACCIGIPAESFVVRNAFQLVGDIVDTLSAAQKVTALQGAVIQLQNYQVQLLQISDSVDSLSDMFRTINMTGSLPTVLPKLEIMLIDIASLNQFVDTMAYYLHNVTAVQYLEVEVANLQTYMKSYLQLTINWYTLALKQQSYTAQQSSLFDQQNTVSAQLKSAANNMLSIDSSLALFESLRISATLRCVIDLLAEQRQVNYYALQNNSLSFTNPTTADLTSAQSKLTTEINVANAQHPSGLLTMWTNFTLTTETNNGSFSSLYSTNQMMFTIELPRPENTKFYQVQIVDIAVYPAPIIAKQSVIDVTLSQKGLNQFYDEHYKVWNFTVPRVDYPFSFSSKYPCPQVASHAHVPDNTYISYSPFGTWQLSLDPDQLDISAIAEVQVFFNLNFYQSPSKSGSELWGNYPFPDTERIGTFVPGCD